MDQRGHVGRTQGATSSPEVTYTSSRPPHRKFGERELHRAPRQNTEEWVVSERGRWWILFQAGWYRDLGGIRRDGSRDFLFSDCWSAVLSVCKLHLLLQTLVLICLRNNGLSFVLFFCFFHFKTPRGRIWSLRSWQNYLDCELQTLRDFLRKWSPCLIVCFLLQRENWKSMFDHKQWSARVTWTFLFKGKTTHSLLCALAVIYSVLSHLHHTQQ